MAQACGVFAGLQARARGEPVRVGFLLGTRRYLASRPWFADGETLEVTARLVLRDGPMAVFDCRISAGAGAGERAADPLTNPIRARRAGMSRRILVTGASKGIGRAIAARLGADGFAVAAHYHSDAAGAEAALAAIRADGGSGTTLGFDIADRAACRAALEADIAAHGAYYGVVLNAGITRDAAFPAMAEQEWDAVLRTNWTGSTTCCIRW